MRLQLLLVLLVLGCASASVLRIGLHTSNNHLARLQNPRSLSRAHRFGANGAPFHPMDNIGEMVYAANITVGTPPQQLLLIVDTTFAGVFVYDISCKSCKEVPQGTGPKLFDSSKSTTLVNLTRQFNLVYMTRGYLVKDVMAAVCAEGQRISITDQPVGLAQDLSELLPADGAIGLAFPSAAFPGFVPPFFNAMNQGAFDNPVFTLFLAKQQRSYEDITAGGGLTYGGVDTENCGDVLGYIPLSTAKKWSFKIESMIFGSYMTSVGQESFISTVSPYVIIPEFFFDRIAAEIGLNDESKEVDCNAKLPNLKLTVGAMALEVTPENYMSKEHYGNSDHCFALLYGAAYGGYNPVWELGFPLLWGYCTVHDMGLLRIGFAPVKQAK